LIVILGHGFTKLVQKYLKVPIFKTYLTLDKKLFEMCKAGDNSKLPAKGLVSHTGSHGRRRKKWIDNVQKDLLCIREEVMYDRQRNVSERGK